MCGSARCARVVGHAAAVLMFKPRPCPTSGDLGFLLFDHFVFQAACPTPTPLAACGRAAAGVWAALCLPCGCRDHTLSTTHFCELHSPPSNGAAFPSRGPVGAMSTDMAPDGLPLFVVRLVAGPGLCATLVWCVVVVVVSGVCAGATAL